MKKNFLYMIMAFAMAMPFTACDDDDNTGNNTGNNTEQQHNPYSDEDQTEITAYDAKEWLQGNLVVVDENDEVLRRIYGKPLDESQPTVISVPVTDLAEAERIFLSWVAPDKEVETVEGGYDYNLTDADGKAQGSVAFRAAAAAARSNTNGLIASMNALAAGLKQVSEVQFIDADMWPENDAVAKYEAGKTYFLEGETYKWVNKRDHYYMEKTRKNMEFYCIQGNDNGKEAILVWLCPDYNSLNSHPVPAQYIRYDVYKHLPTITEAQKIVDIYNADNNAWNEMLATMDAKGYQWSAKLGLFTTGNSEFILNGYDEKNNRIKCLDLDEEVGYICNVSCYSWFNYRYMHIRIFPPCNN